MDRSSAFCFARPMRARASGLAIVAVVLFAGGGPGPWGAFAQEAETASEELQFPNSPLTDILFAYEELTGLKIIKDVNVLGATLSVETTGKITPSEAIRFIEKTLLLNGYAFVPSGDNTVKIISFGSGKQPRSEGVPIFSRVEDLPETDQVVNFFMPLTYITTEEAVRTFTLLIPNHTYGVIVPVPNASAVIISENSAVIRSLVDLAEHVDVPPAQVQNKSIQLERSDAEEVAGILNDLLGAQSESRTGGSAPRTVAAQPRAVAGVPGAAGGQGAAAAAAASAAPGGGASTSESIQPQIIPIVRTNRILVIARPIDMSYIESLIDEFDAPAEIRTFLRRRLKYFRVSDFLPIASDALLRGQETGIGAGGAGALGRTTATRTTAAAGRGAGATGAGGAGGIGGAGGGGGFSGGLGVEAEEMGVAQSLVVGKTLLISDPQANLLIVSGPPETLRIVDELLDELDVRSSQIYLSTVIGEMTMGEQFDWSAQLVRTYGAGVGTEGIAASGGGSGGTALIIDPATLATIGGFAAGVTPVGLYGAGRLDEFHLFINALETNNNFKVLSRPSIFVRNNAVATIRRGERRPIPSSTFTDTTGGQTSNVDYVDIVLELEVTALINSEDEVTLRIAQVNDNTTENVIIDDNSIPVITTQELTTEITVPNQSTVIIGGLISEEKRDDKNGLPFLVNIPVIGGLFGTTRQQDLRRELLIFMQPHIINDVADLVDANTDLTRRTDVAGDVLDFALPEPPDVRQPALEGEGVGDGARLQQALEEEMRKKRQRADDAEAAAEAEKRGWGIFRKRDKGRTGPPARR